MSSDEAFRGSKVVILDFGSQYTQVIARRVRESRVYSEILPFKAGPDRNPARPEPRGIILSGGRPVSFPKDAPQIDPEIFAMGIPVLGICYGVQLMAHHLGGASRVFRSPGIWRRACLHVGNQLPFRRLAVQDAGLEQPRRQSHPLPERISAVGDTRRTRPSLRSKHRRANFIRAPVSSRRSRTPPAGKRLLKTFSIRACGCRHGLDDGFFYRQTCREIRRKVRRRQSRARL